MPPRAAAARALRAADFLMKLAYESLKNILPELNEKVVTSDRLLSVCDARGVEVCERVQKPLGVYVVCGKDEYILIRSLLTRILFHEVLAHETVHACLHEPAAEFLARKQQLEAEALSLVCLMPRTELPRLARTAGSLSAEQFDQFRRRLRIIEVWDI